MKLTATAIADPANISNDITLTITLGDSHEILVDAGIALSDVPLANLIPAGSYLADFGCTGDATLSETHPGRYA